MQFGLFYQLPAWPGQDPAQRYRETLAEIEHGDALGFDVAWLAELHFIPEYSVTPAPMIVAAAAAQRTARIRLGIAVTLLPLHDPLRAAEDAAALDILSEGRLEYGVGRGSIGQHFDGFGIPARERTERFAEGLEVIERAWADEPLTFDGAIYHYDHVNVVPKPLQRPRPRIWMAANSDESIEWAARCDFPLLISSITASRADLMGRTATYQQLRAKGACPAKDIEIAIMVPVYVRENGAEARAEAEASIMPYMRMVARVAMESYLAHGGDPDNVPSLFKRFTDASYDNVLEEISAIGDPDEVCARLRSMYDDYGSGHIMCWFNAGGLIPHDKVMRAMSLFAEQVRPQLP